MKLLYILIWFTYGNTAQQHFKVCDTSTGAVKELLSLPTHSDARIFKAQELQLTAVVPGVNKDLNFESLLIEGENKNRCTELNNKSSMRCILRKGHEGDHNLHDPIEAHGDNWKSCGLSWKDWE